MFGTKPTKFGVVVSDGKCIYIDASDARLFDLIERWKYFGPPRIVRILDERISESGNESLVKWDTSLLVGNSWLNASVLNYVNLQHIAVTREKRQREFFEVESVVAKRQRFGKTEFKVCWVEFPGKATWEPESSFNFFPKVIDDSQLSEEMIESHLPQSKECSSQAEWAVFTNHFCHISSTQFALGGGEFAILQVGFGAVRKLGFRLQPYVEYLLLVARRP